jgi:hypothetical protein
MLNESGLLTLFAWSDIGFPPKSLNKSGVFDQADFAQLMCNPKRRNAQNNKGTNGEQPSEINAINHLSLRVRSRERPLNAAMMTTGEDAALGPEDREQRRPEGQQRVRRTAPK